LLSTRWTDEKGDVRACLRETPAEVPADAAGAEHQDFHVRPFGMLASQ
jgi:hypothetical protein